MDFSEEQLFAQFEREVSTDLGLWRKTLMDFYQEVLLGIYRTAPEATGKELDVTNSEDVRTIGGVLREVMLNNWQLIDDAPTQGDLVSVAGKTIFQIFDRETKSFDTEMIFEDGVVHGVVEGIDVQPYVDEVFLLSSPEEMDKLDLARFVRPFGLHLVLQNATITGREDSDFIGSRLYIPLQYSGPKLSAYANE